MIYFANPDFLYLLLLIPVMYVLYWYMRKLRMKRVAKFGDIELVNRLTPDRPVKKGWVRLVFLSLAFFFFIIGLARPQLGATLKEQEVKGVEIMVALDVSNSMLAEDYSPNRLERAKLAISKLVDGLREDRVGLIVFAGDAFVQLPITTDYVSAKIFLNTINTGSVPVQGTALGSAISLASRSFSAESENSRAIILITDGENHEDDPVAAARMAAENGIRVFCVGVGSPEGKPIPMDGDLLKDENGEIVVTRLDEKILRDVAQAGNGIYVRAGNTEFGLNPIISDIKEMDAKQFKSVVFEDFDEQFMYFLGIALFFLIIEFMFSDKRNVKRLFGRSSSVVLLLLFFSIPSMAQNDKSEVRSGNRDFKKGKFQQAEVEYKKALLKDSSSVAARYNLGNALYRMENMDEAIRQYESLSSRIEAGEDIPGASDMFHNAGNAFMNKKDYQKAVDAYKQSLLRNPSDMETKSNLAYAQKLLKDQQQQQQQQQQNQDQNQNKDQNKDQQNQDQQNQNKDQNQNQQDKNKDQNNQDQQKPDQNDSRQQQTPPKISEEAAQQMLQAIQDKEKETQEKVKAEKAKLLKSKQKKKNW